MKTLLQLNSSLRTNFPKYHSFLSETPIYRFTFRLYSWRSRLKTIQLYSYEFNHILASLHDNTSQLTYKTIINFRSSFFRRKLPVCKDKQYFMLDELGFTFEDTNNLTFIDAGAFDGKTIQQFINYVGGKYDSIYSFEPDPDNFDKVKNFVEDRKLINVFIENKGLHENKSTLNFHAKSSPGSSIGEMGDTTVDVVSLDDYLSNKNVRDLFIKMDIEGAELPAIKGSLKTIEKYSPVLAICIYHSIEDLFDIPLFFIANFPNYNLFIRHHSSNEWESVLYVIPKNHSVKS